MHYANANPLSLAAGQCYQVNSFDLGFINVMPIELVLEVKRVDLEQNELELWVLPGSDQETIAGLITVARWFSEVYPTRTPEDCFLKNAVAFDRFVAQGTAVLRNPSSMKPVPSSTLEAIQRHLHWPDLSDGKPNRI
jgi:hypothetical protein